MKYFITLVLAFGYVALLVALGFVLPEPFSQICALQAGFWGARYTLTALSNFYPTYTDNLSIWHKALQLVGATLATVSLGFIASGPLSYIFLGIATALAFLLIKILYAHYQESKLDW